jgi:hypothetical protein
MRAAATARQGARKAALFSDGLLNTEFYRQPKTPFKTLNIILRPSLWKHGIENPWEAPSL